MNGILVIEVLDPHNFVLYACDRWPRPNSHAFLASSDDLPGLRRRATYIAQVLGINVHDTTKG